MMQGAIFDMDGVLLDNVEFHLEAFRRFGEEQGRHLTRADVYRVFGRKNEDMFPSLLGRELSSEEVVRFEDRKESIYRELIRPTLASHLVPGLLTLLGDLRASSIRMAVATSGPPENAEMVMAELGLGKYFSAVITSRQVKTRKAPPGSFSQGGRSARNAGLGGRGLRRFTFRREGRAGCGIQVCRPDYHPRPGPTRGPRTRPDCERFQGPELPGAGSSLGSRCVLISCSHVVPDRSLGGDPAGSRCRCVRHSLVHDPPAGKAIRFSSVQGRAEDPGGQRDSLTSSALLIRRTGVGWLRGIFAPSTRWAASSTFTAARATWES